MVRSGSTHSLDDVVTALKTGEMQSFWNDSAIVVTEVVRTPQRSFVSVFLVAGDLEGVMSLHDKVYDWALGNNYDFSRISVRPGFARLLQKRGWKKRQVVMELDLHGRQHTFNTDDNQQD